MIPRTKNKAFLSAYWKGHKACMDGMNAKPPYADWRTNWDLKESAVQGRIFAPTSPEPGRLSPPRHKLSKTKAPIIDIVGAFYIRLCFHNTKRLTLRSEY